MQWSNHTYETQVVTFAQYARIKLPMLRWSGQLLSWKKYTRIRGNSLEFRRLVQVHGIAAIFCRISDHVPPVELEFT